MTQQTLFPPQQAQTKLEHDLQLDKIKALVRIARLDEDGELSGRVGWDQGNWIAPELQGHGLEVRICHSKACIAGQAVLAAGAEIIVTGAVDLGNRVVFDYDKDEVFYQGESVGVSILARDLLGLNGIMADRLFDSDNSIHDLETLVHEWSHGNYFGPEQFSDCPQRHETDEELDALVAKHYPPYSVEVYLGCEVSDLETDLETSPFPARRSSSPT